MLKIITADNTETFVNEQVGESYHSQTGAVEEALKKYAIPCKIRELAKQQGKIRILDFCFGLGYNSAMAISEALAQNPACEIEVIGLENDSQILQKIQEVNPPIPFYPHYKKITSERNESVIKLVINNVTVTILLGDARSTVQQLAENHFDAIFYDPFSPRTSAQMWSEDLFKEMWRVLKPSGVLATYSCARMVRDNMSKAGLLYDDGPIVGRRGPGTIATKWI